MTFDQKNIIDNCLDYYLFSEIGINPETGEGISGQRFQDDFDYIQNTMRDVVKTIRLRINSGGGSVVHGLSMISAIRNCAIPVDTYIEGIAASMAGMIASTGRKRYINDFGRIMIHDVSPAASENASPAEMETLNQLKGVLIGVMESNSKYTPEQIDAMMTAETWLNANDALAAGLVDSIVKTDRNIGTFANDSKIVYSFANTLFEQQITKKHHIMKKLTSILNTTETDQTKIEDSAVAEIESLRKQLADANQKAAELQTKLADAEKAAADAAKEKDDAEKAAAEKAAETAVDEAINAGKIETAKRAEMLTIAKKDINAFNTMIASVKATPANAMKAFRNAIATDVKEVDGKIDGKNLRELEKTNSKLVESIRNEKPEVYAKLYFAQYGVEYKG